MTLIIRSSSVTLPLALDGFLVPKGSSRSHH
jgi:hypothetical protein